MAAELQAAIFDVDGTLLDTREFLMQAFEYTLATHGCEVPGRDVIAKHIGRALVECYAALAPGLPYEPLKDTHSDFQHGSLALVARYDGLVEMLEALRQGNVRLGVFSSRYGNLIPSLEQAGVRDMFDVVVDGKQVSRHKPDPEGVLLALGHLSVPPDQAAMIGDAPVDIAAGKAAGVKLTIALTHGFGTRDDLEAARPDYIVNGLHELPTLLLGSNES